MPPCKDNAFTLIEMVMVLVIVAVVASLATPRLARAMVKYRLARAARQVVADLDHARTRARSTAKAQTVQFDPAENQIRLPGAPDPDDPAAEYVTDLAEEPYRTHILSAEFDSDREVIFSGLGECDSGGTVQIRSGDQTATVRLHASSSQAEVE
jgi:type II secretion system protein H